MVRLSILALCDSYVLTALTEDDLATVCVTICHLCLALWFIDVCAHTCVCDREEDMTHDKREAKNMNASLALLSHTLFLSPICCHINTHRSRTEVIVAHTNEVLLLHSDSSSLWPETDPRLHLQSENLHLQHHRLLHNTPSNIEPTAKPLHFPSTTLPPSCDKSY